MQPRGFPQMFGENYFAGFTTGGVDPASPGSPRSPASALGGGCELAMTADFTHRRGQRRFGQPEVKLGVAPGMGGSQRLARAVGKAKAMEMMPDRSHDEALRPRQADLVARVVPAADLLAEALKTAQEIGRDGRRSRPSPTRR